MSQIIQHNEQFLRRRKALLFAPLIVIAFLSLAFYGLGGGRNKKDLKKNEAAPSGLNTTIPGAQLNQQNQPTDKLGFYNKAASDSAKILEDMKRDPYYRGRGTAGASKSDTAHRLLGNSGRVGPSNFYPAPLSTNNADKQADSVLKRLEQLKQALSQPSGKTPGTGTSMSGSSYNGSIPGSSGSPAGPGSSYPGGLTPSGSDPRLSHPGGAPSSAPDPEMEKWNAMLDKIIRIQHPGENSGHDTASPTGSANALSVSGTGSDAFVKTLADGSNSDMDKADEDGGGFMDIGDTGDEDTTSANTIRAVINRDQTLTAGAIVELRLSEEAVIGSIHAPKGNLLYGIAGVSGERLNITVNSIRLGNSVYPVSLSVYDLDGLQGVWVPGAISRDVSKEATDQAITGMELASMDPSLGAQAASAGIQAAKTLASRKVTLVRVSVKAGHEVLLKNTKTGGH